LEFVVDLFFREFLGREITHTLNWDRIILEHQFERPGAVFVVGVLHVGGYGPIGDIHGVDNINISGLLRSTEGVNMRTILRVVGVLLVIFGCIWFLQGVNMLPGSFMTGQIRWAVYGGIAVVVGVGLLFAAKRRTLKVRK
jgi:hypothetical protein